MSSRARLLEDSVAVERTDAAADRPPAIGTSAGPLAATVLALQQGIGNQGVARLLRAHASLRSLQRTSGSEADDEDSSDSDDDGYASGSEHEYTSGGEDGDQAGFDSEEDDDQAQSGSDADDGQYSGSEADDEWDASVANAEDVSDSGSDRETPPPRPLKRRRPDIRQLRAPQLDDAGYESDSEATRSLPKRRRAMWDAERFRELLSERIRERQRLYKETTKGRELEQASRDERDLARLTWILQQLRTSRTCVAALLQDNRVTVYANRADERLLDDLKLIVSAVDGEQGVLDELFERIVAAPEQWPSPKKRAKTIKKAQRRLRKVIHLLRRIVDTHGTIEPHALSPSHEREHEHAEMRAADDVVGRVSGGEAFVAIAKLCCAKCYVALGALETACGIHLHVQGAHFKTYATQTGWPMPRFLLEHPTALAAFLGPDAYRLYLANPTEARGIIEREALDVPGFRNTEMVSSEEERTGSSEDSGDDESEELAADVELQLDEAVAAPRSSSSKGR